LLPAVGPPDFAGTSSSAKPTRGFRLLASCALFLPLATSWVRRRLSNRLVKAGSRGAGGDKDQLDRRWNGSRARFRDPTSGRSFPLAALIVVTFNFSAAAGALADRRSHSMIVSASAWPGVRRRRRRALRFPTVSLEEGLDLQTAPISLRASLWSKFWLNFVPLLLLEELLVFASNLMLRVPPWMMTPDGDDFLMTFGISAIGVGVGALSKFNYDNTAEIPTSFGGVVCMIFSIAFIGAAVMVEAWPIYLLAMEGFRPGRLQVPRFWVLAPSLAALCAVTIAAVIIPLRLGLKHLEELKD
jgi:hypothetical protein